MKLVSFGIPVLPVLSLLLSSCGNAETPMKCARGPGLIQCTAKADLKISKVTVNRGNCRHDSELPFETPGMKEFQRKIKNADEVISVSKDRLGALGVSAMFMDDIKTREKYEDQWPFIVPASIEERAIQLNIAYQSVDFPPVTYNVRSFLEKEVISDSIIRKAYQAGSNEWDQGSQREVWVRAYRGSFSEYQAAWKSIREDLELARANFKRLSDERWKKIEVLKESIRLAEVEKNGAYRGSVDWNVMSVVGHEYRFGSIFEIKTYCTPIEFTISANGADWVFAAD